MGVHKTKRYKMISKTTEWRGCLMHFRIFSSIPGLYLPFSSIISPLNLWQSKMSLDIVKYLLTGKITLMWKNYSKSIIYFLLREIKSSILGAFKLPYIYPWVAQKIKNTYSQESREKGIQFCGWNNNRGFPED